MKRFIALVLVLVCMMGITATAEMFVRKDGDVVQVITFEDGGMVTYAEYMAGVVLAPVSIYTGVDYGHEYSRISIVTNIVNGYTFTIEIMGHAQLVKVKFFDTYGKIIGEQMQFVSIG